MGRIVSCGSKVAHQDGRGSLFKAQEAVDAGCCWEVACKVEVSLVRLEVPRLLLLPRVFV
jgi:hypothetical protein